jgi:transposase
MDKASLEVLLAQGLSVARIASRFGKDPSTVSYWMNKYGLEAVNKERHSGKGGIARETLEPLVEAGMTIAQIATTIGLSKGTVRHWLGRYGLRTHNTAGRRSASIARAAKGQGGSRSPWSADTTA